MGKIGSKSRAKRVQKKYKKLEKEKILAITKIIENLKGTRFLGEFMCDMCRHSRRAGFLYKTVDAEYEICKFCHDSIFDVGHPKVLYTPMGNKR